MTVNYQGNDVDFTTVFYPYAKVREGYRNKVYADNKGIPTVGIGHAIEDGSASIGDIFTDDQVQQLFDQDYNSLQIETYISESGNYTYNMMLAIAHFIWMHGAAAYSTSNLRKGMVAGTFTADSVLTYLASEWDLADAGDQKENAEDFTVAFSSTPWVAPLA